MNRGILDPNFSGCADLEIMLCMFPGSSEVILNQLLDMDCKVYIATSPEDAIEKLQFHSFDIIVIEEGYCMEAAQMTAPMPMTARRNIFIVFVGENVESGNTLQSYILSMNFVLNKNDLASFPQILPNILWENNMFFRPIYNGLKRISNEI